ncbi:hu-li tai shao [Asbolus verrucosus]|uniref:Hu-li tai shao n=1 Tax=Asbolus verrucosus TaxID=1661398 RepID=A0A482W817_ASBVE|nr:hu-li tai shao [Asbolus verrucosus]
MSRFNKVPQRPEKNLGAWLHLVEARLHEEEIIMEYKMTDSSEAEVPPQTNGISDSMDDEERARIRPVEIDADVKEMERRKRVELIMNSKMFREELERIIETQLKDGSGTTGLMQQISDMMGVNKQAGNVFKNSNCVVPINDIRGIEAMGYGKGEKILRCKLAAVFRLIDLYGWTQGTNTLVTARLNQDEEHFLVNPYGMMFHEVTASSLTKVAMQGNVIEQGTTNFSVNISAFSLHAAVHAARPDIKCIINVHTPSVVAISALKHGILPLSQESVVIGDVSTHTYLGGLLDPEEKDKLARNLGPNNKVLLLSNQGALCCGETIEEAFYNARNTVLACESQLKLIPVGLDNLVLLNDEIRKKMYDAAHKAPESSPRPDQPSILEGKVERKWRIGGVEFEALMRMLDNAGFRTGYIYRHPLVKGEPPRPKNDVEVPPAVSSLGYLLEEEELYRQGLWKKLDGGRKGHDRSRWLNSPNVYQKVEILETGTPDPKKITKWVAEGSPTHSSTPVKIDSALQFVPKGTNPKEFKLKQQQIKDYRRADKISAGPQSHILEGVTWEEARKMQDATVTQTGDQVVLMGAASKGIIQRGHQHNAMVYKSPYAKNPFDSVTDEELDEYKKVVEKKVKGEYDTDFSESEGLSSAQLNKRMEDHIRSPTSVTSETEEESRDEPQVLRIETKQAPKPSQPEVVLSDGVKVKRLLGNTRLIGTQPYYRTSNYAGLPKGSYCIPNPQHFHVVRQSHIAQPLRPFLVKIAPQSRAAHYIFNRFNVNCDRRTETVTLNVGNIRTVSLGMSLQTVNDFIRPFAKALNMLEVPDVNHQESQTSYIATNDAIVNSKDYTPLLEGYEENKTSAQVRDDSEFEKKILQKLHENLVADLTRTDSESDLELEDAKQEDIKSQSESDSEWAGMKLEETKNKVQYKIFRFTEKDLTNINESMADAGHIPDGLNSSDESNRKVSDHVAETGKNESLSNGSTISSLSIDEGVGDLTKSTPPQKVIMEPDHRVVKIGKIVFGYMSEQGFEDSDLVIFPELLNDTNTDKLMARLTETYRELYGDSLTSEGRSDLRLLVCSYVLNLIENDERMISSTDSLEAPMVSDKIFSISETLSAIMDHFFESIDGNAKNDSEIFNDFAHPIRNSNGNVNHSTPDANRFNQISEEIPTDRTYEVVEEVTTFKQDQVPKSSYESYWFSIGSPRQQKIVKPTPKRKITNIDDIPLPLPKNHNNSETKNVILSPILEEASRNLFFDFLEDEDDNIQKPVEEMDMMAGGDSENIENILSGRSACYMSFEKPETNIVVSRGVSFNRAVTTVSSAYVKADSVVFKKTNSTAENGDESCYSVASQRENTVNGDQSDAHISTLSQSSKEDRSISEGSPKKDKKKKKGLRTPSFLKKKKEKKIREA